MRDDKEHEWFCGWVDHDSREERRYLRGIIGAILAGACLAVLLMASYSAYGVPLYKSRDGQVSYKLLDTPCSHPEILMHLQGQVRPEFVSKFKDGVLHYQGKDWKSCWIEYQEHIFSIDETGEQLQPIPRAMFRDNAI